MQVSRFAAILFNSLIVLVLFSSIENFGLSNLIAIQIIGNIFFYTRNCTNFFSIGLFFFLFLCLFHYGAIFYEDIYYFEGMDRTLFLSSVYYSIGCISVVNIGYFLSTINFQGDLSSSEVNLSHEHLNRIYNIGKNLFIISFIPMIYLDVSYFIVTFTTGYVDVYSVASKNSMTKFFSIVYPFARASILIMLFGLQTNKPKARIVLLLFTCYSLVAMFSGTRAANIINLVAAFLIYIKFYVKKIKFSQIILFGILGYGVVFLISMVAMLRRASDLNTDNFMLVAESLNESFGESFFGEFGITQVSVVYIIQFTQEFNYGLTYILSLFKISPILPTDFVDSIRDSLTFISTFPPAYKLALGGSCIGELYYNFGYWGTFFSVFIGLLIAKIEKQLTLISPNNMIICISCIVMVPFLFMWVRGYFVEILYVPFWVTIFCLFFKR